jgi:tetratricopeptide (TPR) repeat protein
MLRILDFAAADPMARTKLRGVNRWFDNLVDDNSFWRTRMPLANAYLAGPPKQANPLAPAPPPPLAAARMASSQAPLPLTPKPCPNAAHAFRIAVNGLPSHAELPKLHPGELDALKALLSHAPRATQWAQASIDNNQALKTNAAFMAAALQHDHVFLRCGFHSLAAHYGSAQFESLEAALAFGDVGQCEDAEVALRASVGKDPNLLTSRYLLGCMLRHQGKRDAALAVFADVIATRPDYAEAYFLYGVILKDQKKYLQALQHFDMALAHKPGLANARLCQGETLLGLGRYQQAVEALTTYRGVDPTNSAAAAGEAWARYKLGDIAKALDVCDTFLQRFPQDIVLRLTRGNIYFHMSPVSLEALADYEAVLAASPHSRTAQAQRSQLLDNRDALYNALKTCDEAILSGLDLGEAYLNRAMVHYRYKNFSAAYEDCSMAAAEHRSAKLYVLQAAICYELAYAEQADEYERRATLEGEDAYNAAYAAIWPDTVLPP